MIEDHFSDELQRVVDVFGELPVSHVKELRRAYLRVDRRLWAQMVNHVIDNSQFVPRPARFKAAYQVLQMNWRTEDDDKQMGCEMCSLGFQDVYFVHNGLPYSGVTPCTCNSIRLNHGQTQAERYITREQYDAMILQGQATLPTREHEPPAPVKEETEQEVPATDPEPGPKHISDSMPQLPEDLKW